MERKRLVSQLQSFGEGTLDKLAQSPATRGAVHNARQVRERGGRLVHTLESIEARLTAIEARLASIEGAAPSRSAVRTRTTTRAPRGSSAAAGAKAKSGASG